MADIDIVAKSYFSNNSFFADAVNYAVYHGEEVVKPESLTELNASAVVVPFEGGMRIPLQRYRDTLKLCEVKVHGNSAYMILGVEEQTEVDFAMPFRTLLYDAIGYARQITEINSAYKKNAELNKKARVQREKREEEGLEILYDEEKALVTLVGGKEFLSGMKREDRLLPIITVVVHVGAKGWDGPTTVHEMLSEDDPRALRHIPNFELCVIDPAKMDGEDFGLFRTDLGFAMKVFKHQKDDVAALLASKEGRRIDPQTAQFIDTTLNLNLKYTKDASGGVNMCEGMVKNNLANQIVGMIDMCKDFGLSEEKTIARVKEKHPRVDDEMVRDMYLHFDEYKAKYIAPLM